MSTKRRIYIAPGIFREGDRLIAEVETGSRNTTRRRERRLWPLGTDVHILQAWQHHTRAEMLITSPRAERGTLAADVPAFLATLPAGPYQKDSAAVLAHWIRSRYGAGPRHALTRLDVIAQIAEWTDQGVAAATCNRRLSRLRRLFQTLDGITAPNPTDAIRFLRQPETEARSIPVRIVKLILESLPDQGRAERGHERPTVSRTKIRLSVMAWTGLTPASMRRLRPRDLDLENGRIYLPARKKGKGAAGAWVSILPHAIEALKQFAAENLFGLPIAKMGKTWRVGIARAKTIAADHAARTGDQSWQTDLAHLPPRCKPYDLRHSFATEVYSLTGDIRAVAELLQHADLETTKRYTKGAVSERVTAAITVATAAHAAIPTIPAAPAPAASPARPALRLVKRA